MYSHSDRDAHLRLYRQVRLLTSDYALRRLNSAFAVSFLVQRVGHVQTETEQAQRDQEFHLRFLHNELFQQQSEYSTSFKLVMVT